MGWYVVGLIITSPEGYVISAITYIASLKLHIFDVKKMNQVTIH